MRVRCVRIANIGFGRRRLANRGGGRRNASAWLEGRGMLLLHLGSDRAGRSTQPARRWGLHERLRLAQHHLLAQSKLLHLRLRLVKRVIEVP
eukprot:scaffold256071_cov32-Tisochrysis_lutea.AAC.2